MQGRGRSDPAVEVGPVAVISPAAGPDPCRATWAISLASAAAFGLAPEATVVFPAGPADRLDPHDRAAMAEASPAAPEAVIGRAADSFRIAQARGTTVDPDDPAGGTAVDLDDPAGATADGRAAPATETTAGQVGLATALARPVPVKAAAERNGPADDRRGTIGPAAGQAASIAPFTPVRVG
jgi:hypothetical protein